ncbi:MAG: type IIL restriction-modification enzyme MmeI [Aridibacter sp.]
MPQLTQSEIRNNAFAFVNEWKDESRESAESQSFWNEFFSIFGVIRKRVATFEKAVKKSNDNKGSIDLFWKKKLLVEHKSRGQDLEKATSQAFDYLVN